MRLIVTAATAAMQPRVNPKRPAASIRALIRGSSSGLRRGRSTPQNYTRSALGRRPLDDGEVSAGPVLVRPVVQPGRIAERASSQVRHARSVSCLLYTSDAADERSSVDLGGRRII